MTQNDANNTQYSTHICPSDRHAILIFEIPHIQRILKNKMYSLFFLKIPTKIKQMSSAAWASVHAARPKWRVKLERKESGHISLHTSIGTSERGSSFAPPRWGHPPEPWWIGVRRTTPQRFMIKPYYVGELTLIADLNRWNQFICPLLNRKHGQQCVSLWQVECKGRANVKHQMNGWHPALFGGG